MHEIAVLHNWGSCEVAAFLTGKPASLMNTNPRPPTKNRRHPSQLPDSPGPSPDLDSNLGHRPSAEGQPLFFGQ